MKKYFEIVGKRQTLELNIIEGSPAAKASVEELGKALNCELKELTKSVYRRLSVQYNSDTK